MKSAVNTSIRLREKRVNCTTRGVDAPGKAQGMQLIRHPFISRQLWFDQTRVCIRRSLMPTAHPLNWALCFKCVYQIEIK
jgi:hypothetical protein